MNLSPYRAARPGGLAAVVLIVLLLAASALFSAASAHHAGHSHAGQTQVEPVAVGDEEAAHDHQHGNEWTPQPVQRLRAAAQPGVAIALVVVLPDRPAEVASTAYHDSDRLGVLRI